MGALTDILIYLVYVFFGLYLLAMLLRFLLQDQSILLHNSLEMEETICGEG